METAEALKVEAKEPLLKPELLDGWMNENILVGVDAVTAGASRVSEAVDDPPAIKLFLLSVLSGSSTFD